MAKNIVDLTKMVKDHNLEFKPYFQTKVDTHHEGAESEGIP